MQNKIDIAGPIALTNTLTTNLLSPAAAGAGGTTYTATADVLYVRKIKVVNKTAAIHTVTLFKGATGANTAGTEFIWNGKSVPANDSIEEVGLWRLEGTNGFIVGGADANTALTIEFVIEIGKV